MTDRRSGPDQSRSATPDERRRLEEVYAGYESDGGRWSLSNPGNRLMVAQRARLMEQFLIGWRPHGLGRARVLDLGCGVHSVSCPTIDDAGPAVARFGIDLLFDRTRAACTSGQFAGVACADGSALPLAAASVDLVLIFTVFSSIADDAICAAIGRDVTRVIKQGGAVLWYDLAYPNPANRQVRAVPRASVERWFPSLRPSWRRTTLLPPLARRLGQATDTLYPVLSRLPLLTSHHLGILTAP